MDRPMVMVHVSGELQIKVLTSTCERRSQLYFF